MDRPGFPAERVGEVLSSKYKKKYGPLSHYIALLTLKLEFISQKSTPSQARHSWIAVLASLEKRA
jgi:hypothetical protein